MSYQPTLPGLPNPGAGRRREPRRKSGERWPAYCFRWETWHRSTFRKRTPEERIARSQINAAWRERVMRSTEVFIYRATQKRMRQVPPGAVFFWFGGDAGYPGPQAQYLNAAALAFLEQIQFGKPHLPVRPRKRRVHFGPCGP